MDQRNAEVKTPEPLRARVACALARAQRLLPSGT
jgi:hypothetical protein